MKPEANKMYGHAKKEALFHVLLNVKRNVFITHSASLYRGINFISLLLERRVERHHLTETYEVKLVQLYKNGELQY